MIASGNQYNFIQNIPFHLRKRVQKSNHFPIVLFFIKTLLFFPFPLLRLLLAKHEIHTASKQPICNTQCNAFATAPKKLNCYKMQGFHLSSSFWRLYRAHRTKTLPNMATFFSPFSVQNKKAHDPTIQRTIMSFSMPPTGVEPVLCLQKGILSPSCLPISPQRRKNPAYKALLLPQNERAGNNRSEVKNYGRTTE